ncbi:hypothetical protein M0R45_004358 [Rubus argutus]|uniref:Uncharacterized protein n=1 Tax=Rubus argutus TaxID=59490 RepID=A0AAW1YJM7_RUBAR
MDIYHSVSISCVQFYCIAENTAENVGAIFLLRFESEALRPLIHNDGPEKHTAKALFKDLCSRVETLLTTKVHFKKELGNTKSWLDELQPLQVNYIQVIEERNVSLNFWIKEVEDYKKELSKGIKLCEDFSREDNSGHKSASADPLYQLNRDLKKQFEVLTAKKLKGRTLSLRFW